MDQDGFSRSVYAPALRDQSSTPLFKQRVLSWLPIGDILYARFRFAKRFDQAVAKLSSRGNAAFPSVQARVHFDKHLRLQVNPQTITQRLCDYISDGRQVRWIGTYFLDGGDWSPILRPVHKSSSHTEVVEICRLRHDFRKGERYQHYVSKMERGLMVRRNHVRIDTVERLDAYFEYYLALVESIERDGVVPFSDVGLLGHTGRTHRWARSLWQDLSDRDIGVAIGADGKLVRHTAGKHRMAISVALGLESIPVEVRMVHVRWLQDQMRRFGLPASEALVAGLEDAKATGRFLQSA